MGMAPKAVRKAAEAAGLLKTVTKAPIPRGKPSIRGLDDLTQYQQAANELDSLELAKTPQDVLDRVARNEMVELENQRLKAISPENTKISILHQSKSAEEFKARVPQLTNPEFAKSSLDLIRSGSKEVKSLDEIPLVDVKTSQEIKAAHSKFLSDTEKLTRSLMKDPRIGPQLKAWYGDGAYTRRMFGDTSDIADEPMIFFHIDTKTDPTGRPIIQFSRDANEFGLHIGSADAIMAFENIVKQPRLEFGTLTSILRKSDKKRATNLADAFDAAVQEQSQAMFRRGGDDYIGRQATEELEKAIDGAFEGLSADVKTWLVEQDRLGNFDQLGLTGALERGTASVDRMKMILKARLKSQFDSTAYPVIPNVKNGLVLPDIQSWTARNISKELEGLGIIDDDTLFAIQQASNAEGNDMLRSALNKAGYDHIAYHNANEDAGNLSLLLFEESTVQNALAPTVGRQGAATRQQITNVFAGLTAFAASLREDGG